MAKKKVNIEIPRSGAAAEVPSGDVNIVYNNVRIAGLSETIDATLKTGGTVVQHDIEVEYTKPASGIPVGNTVNFNNNTVNSITIGTTYGISYDNIGGFANELEIAANSTTTVYAFSGVSNNYYRISFTIASETDQYIITTDSSNWEYDPRDGAYSWGATDTSPINNQTYNVVITDKE